MSAEERPPEVRSYPLAGGAQGEVLWEAGLCRHAAECVRGLPEVFDTAQRPWIQPDQAPPADVERVVARCPSRALRFRRGAADDREARAPRA
jgi:uncharacterized Fe-S cluster protein YjdI